MTTNVVVLPPGCKRIDEIAPGNPESIHDGLHHSEHPLEDYWARYIAPEFGGPDPYDGFVDSALNLPTPADAHLITVSTTDSAVDSDDEAIVVRSGRSGRSSRNITPINSRSSRFFSPRKRQSSPDRRASSSKRLATSSRSSSWERSDEDPASSGIFPTIKGRSQSRLPPIQSSPPTAPDSSPVLDFLQSLTNTSLARSAPEPAATLPTFALKPDLLSPNTDKPSEYTLPNPNIEVPFFAQSLLDQDMFLAWFHEACRVDRGLRTNAIQAVFSYANPRDLVFSHQRARLRIQRFHSTPQRESHSLSEATALYFSVYPSSSITRPLHDVINLE